MDDEPTKDLATRAFQKRVLDEFAAVRREQAEMRKDISEVRTDVREVQTQQAAMAKNIAVLDQRVTSIDQRVTSIDRRLTQLEDKVDRRLQETRPIWEGVQEQLQTLVEKFDFLILDFHDLRQQVRIHGRRIGKLEQRVSS